MRLMMAISDSIFAMCLCVIGLINIGIYYLFNNPLGDIITLTISTLLILGVIYDIVRTYLNYKNKTQIFTKSVEVLSNVKPGKLNRD